MNIHLFNSINVTCQNIEEKKVLLNHNSYMSIENNHGL